MAVVPSLLGSLTTLVAGAVFGLALAAPPGPMNAIIAEETVVRGWTAGFWAGLGAMVADATFLALSLAGVVAFVGEFPRVRGAMIGIGGLLMLYFAYGAVRSARAVFVPEEGPEGESKGFRKAFALALTNPYQILFWLTVGVALLEPGTVDVLGYVPYVGASLTGRLVIRTGTPFLLIGLFAGITVWITGFPAALVAARKRVEGLAPIVAGVSAVVLAGFGVLFLWEAAGTFA
ncbi:MAG: LysE family translocator [Haloarculaceae archaeon]